MIRPARFYPVLPDAEWVGRVLGWGACFVQLRCKLEDPAAVRAEIRRSLELERQYGACVVINDYWQEAIDAGATFIHLGQEDLATADLAAIHRHGLQFGLSTHSHEELEAALATNPDYVALGPVYPTQLKKMPWAPQGLERVQEWKQRIGDLPLVAIGGIDLERAPGCYQAGADSVAMVGDIVRHADPAGQTAAWLKLAGEFPA